MQHNGLTPRSGPVIVNGATGGVGSVAIDVLSRLGLPRRRADRQGKGDRLPAIDRSIRRWCCARASTSPRCRPLDKSTWAGAIDNLGGEVLAWMLVRR
jgi:NADPH:quinone reductase-like Zn-dependent oxidoreductase